MTTLPHEMPHKDIPTLRDADAEQKDEHDDIGAVSTGSQRLVANLIDEERDDHLRQAVG